MQDDDSALWSASSGIMSLKLSFAEKVRQARALDAVLEGLDHSSDDDDEQGRCEVSWTRAAVRAALAAAAPPGQPSTPDDAASIASTTLRCSASRASSSSFSSGSGASSYALPSSRSSSSSDRSVAHDPLSSGSSSSLHSSHARQPLRPRPTLPCRARAAAASTCSRRGCLRLAARHAPLRARPACNAPMTGRNLNAHPAADGAPAADAAPSSPPTRIRCAHSGWLQLVLQNACGRLTGGAPAECAMHSGQHRFSCTRTMLEFTVVNCAVARSLPGYSSSVPQQWPRTQGYSIAGDARVSFVSWLS